MPQDGVKVFKASSRTGPVGRIPFAVESLRQDGTVTRHAFSAVDAMPVGAQIMFAGYLGDDGTVKVADGQAVTLILPIFRMILPRSDFTRFQALIEDPEVSIEAQTLMDILMWLIQEITGRPTSPSGSSANGPSTTSPSSTADASAPAAFRSPLSRLPTS